MDPFGMMTALSFFLNNLATNFYLRVVLIKIPSLLPATLTSYPTLRQYCKVFF